MSRPTESLLADAMAVVGPRVPSEYPNVLCDTLLNNAWALEYDMFSEGTDWDEIYRKARDVTADGLRIMREALHRKEENDGC